MISSRQKRCIVKVQVYITPTPGTAFADAMKNGIDSAQGQGHVYFVVHGLKVYHDASGYYVDDSQEFLPTGTFRIDGARITRIAIVERISVNAPRDGFYRYKGATACVHTERHSSNADPLSTILTVTGRTARGVTTLYNLVRSGVLSPESVYVSEPVDS